MKTLVVVPGWKTTLWLVPVFFYCWLVHRGGWSEYPEGIHTWAQADQVALIDGFRENGYDIFHPQTYVFNHQFPNDWETADQTRITAVDFPWYQWMCALLADLFHASSTGTASVVTFILSLVGLLFLYRSVLLWRKSVTWAILACCFFASLPLFSYYQVRILPSVPALSLFLCGFYCYLKFRATAAIRSVAISIALLTLAALLRTTYLIPLLSILGIELISLLRDRQQAVKKIAIAAASLSIIFVLAWWNMNLRKTYGSLFLSELLPANSWSHLLDILNDIRSRWVLDYFTIAHYLLLAVLVFLAFGLKARSKGNTPVFGLFCLLILGGTLFFFAMARQFPLHDYYYMDVVYPAVAVMMVQANPLEIFRNVWIRGVLAATLTGFLLVLNVFQQRNRLLNISLDVGRQTNNAFYGSAQFLTANGVGATAKILVLPCHSPNLPFLQLKRAGFAGMSRDSVQVNKYLGFPADFVVIENNAFFREFVSENSGIFRKLKPLASNGRITICKRVDDGSATEASFLQQLLRHPLGEYDLRRDSAPFDNVSRGFSATSKEEFGVGITLSGPVLPQRANYLRTELSMPLRSGQVLIVSVTDQSRVLLYTSVPADEKNVLLTGLPADRSPNAEVKVYIYNPGRHPFRVNGLKVAVY